MIGFAGSDAKVDYLKELGYDEAINYKKITNLDETIKKAAPKGVDIYFDNVCNVFRLTFWLGGIRLIGKCLRSPLPNWINKIPATSSKLSATW